MNPEAVNTTAPNPSIRSAIRALHRSDPEALASLCGLLRAWLEREPGATFPAFAEAAEAAEGLGDFAPLEVAATLAAMAVGP